MQFIEAAGQEMKAICIERYPDLAEKVDASVKQWEFAETHVSVVVNGKPYIGNEVIYGKRMARERWASRPDSEVRADCSRFGVMLDRLASAMSQEERKKFVLR